MGYRKIRTIFLSLLFFSNTIYSQTWLWAKSVTGNGTGEGWAVTSDKHGNAIITGGFASPTLTFGSITLTNSGSWNIFVAKYDPNGNVLWAKNPSGSGADGGLAICTDASGNVFVTGWFSSPTLTFGSSIITHAGSGYDIFIAKYDPNGNELWAKKAGGLNDDGGLGVCTDANGNVIITGYFKSSSVTFDTVTLTNAGNYNIFLAKYDPNGNLIWAKSAGGSGDDEGYGVNVDGSGNLFITGEFNSTTLTFGTTTLTNNGSYDIFIAKYDANGNVMWAHSSGGSDDDEGFAVSADQQGNLFVTGFFSSSSITFGSTPLINAGGPWHNDIFLTKYDPGGNVLWAQRTGGTSSDIAGAICVDAVGNVLLSGRCYSPGFYFDTLYVHRPSGSIDPMFVAKYNSSGHILCASILQSGGDDESGTSVDPWGNIYVTGDFMVDTFIVGSDSLFLAGGENVFLAKYFCCGKNAPVTASTSFDTICSGRTTTLNIAGGYEFGTSDSWQWSTGSCGGVSIGNGISVNVSPTSSTTYFVKGEGYCNLSSCDSIYVKVNVTPTASYTAEYIANCSGIMGYFKNESMNADNYIWNFSDGNTFNQFNINHVFSFQSSSSVSLIALNNSGCKDSLTLNNKFDSFQDFCKISIPNIFTPNNDGINDEFKINSSFDLSECISITIFDRWGKVMYSETNSTIKWDGRTTSELKASSGVYFYILNINDIKYKGSITLLD